ncbi:S26 family signal peptidase [Methylomonas sp. MO1]|uniref:S26 family signal peptidase n=1 Tax=Methylomonas sp. MO1 TaxID=3073619 RepID=UPI0028A40C30|nr:S26 family signal peptidase [Methylomonas sp. MO1]MDT4291873.1 S26 family signal peptidase [Methylomonas sp. MO1]
MSVNQSSLWPTLLSLLAAVVFGLPIIYTVLCHPISRMASPNPLYKELSKNAFMVMSAKVDLAAGRLISFNDAAGKLQISRIVGMPGDEIGFTAGVLSVNGKPAAEYPRNTLLNATLIVPQQAVFYFPDFIPDVAESTNPGTLANHLLAQSNINASVLYVFDQATSAAQHPELFVYGSALIVLYGLVFFGLGKRKDRIVKPVYHLARISVGLNFAIWLLLGVLGISFGYKAIMPAIYYAFVSWLTFFGLSVAAAGTTLVAIVIFAVLALFSDTEFAAKRINP